jgi:hypothetical protein
MAIAAFAWDMWQTWLVCAIALTLLYLNVAAMNFDAAKQSLTGSLRNNRFGGFQLK